MTLPKQTHLITRNGTYYFRRRIPLDLLPFYTPKLEILFSLKTKDLALANRLARAESVRLDDHFETLRGNQTVTPQDAMSEEDIKKLSDAWIAHILEEDEEVRIEGLSDSDYRKIEESLGIVEVGGKMALARGDISLIEFEMEDFCESHGFKLSKGSEAYQRLAYSFLKASVQTNDKLIQRHQGEVVDTPEAPIINSKTYTKSYQIDSLEGLRDYWLSQSPKSRTAISEANTMIKKFRAMVGNLKPSEVTREHVVLLKDKMLETNSSPATINKGRGILAAIFSVAEQNLKIESNPFKGVKSLAVPPRTIERAYTLDELQTIFNSPIYTQGYRPKRFPGESVYWIPLLAMYSGARLNELGQIYTDDIGIEDNINFYVIRQDAKTNRSVKDGRSRRVPLHPDLIKMGFLDYAAKIKSEGHVQLFPELKITRAKGKLADKWGTWWCEYVRNSLNITRVPQPTHGFRHTFISHCRRCMVDSEHRRLIEGHVPNTVEMQNYGDLEYPIDPLYKELCKLSFKGLDLANISI